MINKKLNEIKEKLNEIEELIQDVNYIDFLDNGLKKEHQINVDLQNRINRAIEYIETKECLLLNCDDDFLEHDEVINKKRYIKIIEILKGIEEIEEEK